MVALDWILRVRRVPIVLTFGSLKRGHRVEDESSSSSLPGAGRLAGVICRKGSCGELVFGFEVGVHDDDIGLRRGDDGDGDFLNWEGIIVSRDFGMPLV